MSGIHRFSASSFKKLDEVHQDLRLVAIRALEISPYDFGVYCGVRSLDEQRELFRSGQSKTMNSRHLHGFAIDVVGYMDGKPDFDTWSIYQDIATSFFQAAHTLGKVVQWGGHFGRFEGGIYKPFRDGVHFQLPSSLYPDPI